MAKEKHLQDHDVKVLVYYGLCENILDHSHASFLFIFFNEDKKQFWITLEILNNQDKHSHSAYINEKQADLFLNKGEINLQTDESEPEEDMKSHVHQLYFNISNKQGLILNPFL